VSALLESRTAKAVAAVVLALALVGVGIGLALTQFGSSEKHLTAYFRKTIGLYNGNAVDIMGVQVGHIDSLTDEGDSVRVDISYDGQYKLPNNVRAVLVTPSVVSDRYIQLQPVYRSGPVLANNAVLKTDRTAIPLEFDDIFKNVDSLDKALGPKGANAHGALRRLIKVSDENLKGNGGRLHDALANFSQAVSTLAGSRGNLFATVSHLQQFTTAIAHDDGGVRALNANLAKVGTQLYDERHDLGAALANLSTALRTVNGFIASNRTELTSDVHGLTKVSQDLQVEKKAITQLVDGAGPAVANLALAGDPRAGTLDTNADITEPLGSPGKLKKVLCQVLGEGTPLGKILGSTGVCAKGSGGGGGGLPIPSPPVPSPPVGHRTGGIGSLLGAVGGTKSGGTK
jgi:phospholipid/cholesterol/gamma-HCH transport system substrate-binding protein